MDFLPSESERHALLNGLATLIEARGFETFVSAPLLEPSPEFFPDAWEPSKRGVRKLALRLLRYAGNEKLGARVVVYNDGEEPEGAHANTVAWFAGIENDECLFGVHVEQLKLDDAVVGTLCHEVAHAYRAWTNLAEAFDQLEEENTDLTTIYLGFGILTTNNAYRFRKEGKLLGTMAVTRWSTSETGYLSPQSMAFLLAAQVTARGVTAAVAKRIGRYLEPNQQAFFNAARKELEKDVDGLRIRLGIPPQEIWPEPRALDLASLSAGEDGEGGEDDDSDNDEVDYDTSESNFVPWNTGANIFRVLPQRRVAPAFFGAAFGAVTACFAGQWADFEISTVILCAAFCGSVIGFLGWRSKDETCSEPRCEATLPPEASNCPKCGGTIRGTISNASQRLEAEEALSCTEVGSDP